MSELLTQDRGPPKFDWREKAMKLEAEKAELLEALRTLVKANAEGPATEWASRMFECDKVARAAIAKAEGK